MTKKDFIGIADAIRDCETKAETIDALALYFGRVNPRFIRHRWLSYLAGECGPNGGAVKT